MWTATEICNVGNDTIGTPSCLQDAKERHSRRVTISAMTVPSFLRTQSHQRMLRRELLYSETAGSWETVEVIRTFPAMTALRMVIMCRRSARKHVVYRKVVMHSDSDLEAERLK